jgi:hypothetical protein
MKLSQRSVLFYSFSLFTLALAAPNSWGRADEWTDTQGAKFRGEPMELAEPYAFFRSDNRCKMVPLTLLTPDDCFRFYEAVEKRGGPAPSWAHATGRFTAEVGGTLLVPEGDSFVPMDITNRPEPEFMVVFYVDKNDEREREMVGAAIPPFEELAKRYPHMVEAFYFGMDSPRFEQAATAHYMHMPWPIADVERRSTLPTMLRHAAPEDYGIVVFSRDGDPVFAEAMPHEADVKKLFASLEGLVGLMQSENPKSWGARGYFWGAVQQKKFADGQSGPLLIGNPFLATGLIQRKVYRIDAQIHVTADGKITDVKVKPDSQMPEKMAAPIAAGLKHAMLVPAVDHGKFVDGTYEYHFEAPNKT